MPTPPFRIKETEDSNTLRKKLIKTVDDIYSKITRSDRVVSVITESIRSTTPGGTAPTTVPDHDHSGDSGDGAQLDWDDIFSDAVHSHQTDAEGSKLDHGAALDGLTDDDHTQYILADGTRAFSGNIRTGGNYLSSDGDNEGVMVTADGYVAINKATTTFNFEVNGSAAIGDGTNYTGFETDGTLTMNGTATVWGVVQIPVSAMIMSVSVPPNLTGHQAGYSFGFDPTADEIASFRVELPPDYKEGTDVVFYLHWSPPDANAGDIVWSFSHSWVNIESAFPAATTIAITISTDSTADKHHRDGFAALTGTGKTIGSIIQCSIARDANNGSDTYASDVLLHSMSMHYEKDTLGSRTITTK